MGADLAKISAETGIGIHCLIWRINKKGLTLEEAIAMGVPVRRPAEDLAKIRRLARSCGMSLNGFKWRLKRHGCTPEEAAAMGGPHRKLRDASGLAAVARRHGLKYMTLWYRVNRRGLTVEEALAWEPPPYRSSINPYPIQDAAAEYGMKETAFLMRMHVYGCSEDAAYALGPARKGGRYAKLTVLDLTREHDRRLTARESAVYDDRGEVYQGFELREG